MIVRPFLSVGRRARRWHVLHALEPLLAAGTRILDAGSLSAARARARRLPIIGFERAAISDGELFGELDVVACANFLEHIADEEAAFAWLARRMGDTWTYLRRAHLAKLVLLPFLLGADALEGALSRARRGNGPLLPSRVSV